MSEKLQTCWVCQSTQVEFKQHGLNHATLTPQQFCITATDYGVTGDLYRCKQCGFIFCPTVQDVLTQYQSMSDPEYENTREQRALQAEKLLGTIRRHKPQGALLDIGAGSGILIEQAKKYFPAVLGIEPSLALSAIAQRRNLPVVTGVLPRPDLAKQFDIVTLIDVIEHVEEPLNMLRDSLQCMRDDAICVIVTPDINSIAARLMGKKWWHFRLAHISYFNRITLTKILHNAGLEPIATYRPSWYFPASYLFERAFLYLPRFLKVKTPAFLDRVTIPLNLFDSLMIIAKKQSSDHQLTSTKNQ